MNETPDEQLHDAHRNGDGGNGAEPATDTRLDGEGQIDRAGKGMISKPLAKRH